MRRSLKARDMAGLVGASALLAGSMVAIVTITLIVGTAARALWIGTSFAGLHGNRKRGKA